MIRLKFIQDDAADGIEVVVRAKSRDEEVRRLLHAIEDGGSDPIVCKTTDDREVDPNDIVIVSKDGRFLSVKTTSGEFAVGEPLYKFEEKLDPSKFVRISQSEIVNLRYVKGWSFEGGGIIRIELEGGIKSYTSRRYASEIRKILKKGERQ